jgi:hypothetical protein
LIKDDYQTLGKHVRDSLLFSSNIRYLKEAGYFDSASHEKWLLHTWSLSVEWQFYLLQPLLLMAAWKLRPRRSTIIGLMLGMALISLGLCIWQTGSNPSKAFYSIQTRAWEMLLGGLVYLLASKAELQEVWRRGLEFCGLLMVAAAVLMFDSEMFWPGWYALLPTLGTALVLVALNKQSVFTGNRIAQWLGARSYSLYLWHWPLVVFLVYLERLTDPIWVISGLILTLLLGHLSYHYVEVSTRDLLSRLDKRRAWLLLVVLVTMVALLAQYVRNSDFPDRPPNSVIHGWAEEGRSKRPSKGCSRGSEHCVYAGSQVRVMLVGDSHARAVVNAVVDSLPDPTVDGLLFQNAPGCPVVFGARMTDKFRAQLTDGAAQACEALSQRLEDKGGQLTPGMPIIIVNRTSLAVFGGVGKGLDPPHGKPTVYFSVPFDHPDPVLLQEFRTHYIDTVCKLTKHHPVYLMRPIPEMGVNVPNVFARALLFGRSREVSISMRSYQQRHAFAWDVQNEARDDCGAVILDPLPYLCDTQNCFGTRDSRPLYSDDDHLNEFGRQLLVPMFSSMFSPSESTEVQP